MAFFCKKQSKYWHEEAEYDVEQYDDLYSRINRFQSYRNTEKKLKILQKSLASDKEGDVCIRNLTLLDMQLTQVALWLYGMNLTKDVDDSAGKSVVDCLEVQHVELLIHAISLRKLMQRNRCKTSLKGPYSTDEVSTAMGLHAAPPTSKAKQQAKMRREASKLNNRGRRWNESINPVEGTIVDHDLEDLCKLPESQLERRVTEALRGALASLRLNQSGESTAPTSRRRKKKTITSGRLNEKLDRPNDPWKSGMRRQHDGNDDTRARRWKKSKQVVSSRRQQAIEQRLT